MKVSDLLKGKGSAIKSIAPKASIRELADKLRVEGVGALVVCASEHQLDGIVSERDVVRGYAAHGAGIGDLTVADLMTRSVITCTPDEPIAKVARIMTERRIRHLPVRDGDKLVGVISIGDVLKSRIDEVQLEANVLRDYAIAAR